MPNIKKGMEALSHHALASVKDKGRIQDKNKIKNINFLSHDCCFFSWFFFFGLQESHYQLRLTRENKKKIDVRKGQNPKHLFLGIKRK